MTNYEIFNEEATVHHYGKYMSYSTRRGDYISRPAAISPYRAVKSEQVQVGETQEVRKVPKEYKESKHETVGENTRISIPLYTEGELDSVIATVPVMQTRLVDVTPRPKVLGKPIRSGDLVIEDKPHGLKGTIQLFDDYLTITNDHGIHYRGYASVHYPYKRVTK